jgi:hypothetical protein
LDPSLVSALAALAGSLVGGSASIATAWVTHKIQSRQARIKTEIASREQMYAEFIDECSKLAIDALDHTLDDTAKLMHVYALRNRIRLIGSDGVDHAAEETVRNIVTPYLKPNLTRDEFQQMATSPGNDPLRPFADACRYELTAMRRAT